MSEWVAPVAAAYLSLLLSSCSTSDECLSSIHASVIDGIVDSLHEQVVGLVVRDKVVCSGTLISERDVLTAAHCLAEAHPEFARFVGVAGDVVEVTVESETVHPDFSLATLEHDIGVLRLADAVPGVRGARLGSVMQVEEGAAITIVGFGLDTRSSTSAMTNERRRGEMLVSQVSAETIRALPNPATGCSQDSGGAAFVGDRLVAVVSRGDAACVRSTVFSRADTYRRFIEDVSDARWGMSAQAACDSDHPW